MSSTALLRVAPCDLCTVMAYAMVMGNCEREQFWLPRRKSRLLRKMDTTLKPTREVAKRGGYGRCRSAQTVQITSGAGSAKLYILLRLTLQLLLLRHHHPHLEFNTDIAQPESRRDASWRVCVECQKENLLLVAKIIIGPITILGHLTPKPDPSNNSRRKGAEEPVDPFAVIRRLLTIADDASRLPRSRCLGKLGHGSKRRQWCRQ